MQKNSRQEITYTVSLTGPLKHVFYGLSCSWYQSALIGVLQPQDERASILLCKYIIIESSSETSEVQEAYDTKQYVTLNIRLTNKYLKKMFFICKTD